MVNCTGKIQNGIYNCFGKYDESMCYDCIHNKEKTESDAKERFINFRDKIDILYKYLKGEEVPEGVHCKKPTLSPDLAFAVIYFLQEIMHVLPDTIEQCDGCKELFDTDSSGWIIDADYIDVDTGETLAEKYWGHWCDDCVPDIEIEIKQDK